ncbi:uncharacterized protein [Diadema setosum]
MKRSASMPESDSTLQRQRGNQYYRTATQNVGITVRTHRYEAALACYHNALTYSTNGEEEASALKNIAMASWKIASLHTEREPPRDHLVIRSRFKEALKSLCLACEKWCWKNEEWGVQVEESREQCFKESTDWLATLDMKERIAGFSDFLGCLTDSVFAAEKYVDYSTLLFHEGVQAWQKGDFKECLRFMMECNFPLNEAERMCQGDPLIDNEITVLREDVYLHTCLAESNQARAAGEALLKKELEEQEELNTDMVWIVVDFFKEAITLCRDKDLEQEAIALSRLGRVYGKVLKLSVRGKDNYKKAIELALSMTPRNFQEADWYKESTAFVEEYQNRLNKEEHENKEKRSALDEMKDDVSELKDLNSTSGTEEFVEELYKRWPPKAPGAKFNKNLSKKKLLIKAISHYHPDKVSKEIHGKKWYFFSAEITKILNERYTREKFPEDHK